MLIDLVQIKREGDRLRPENERFRKHLKSHDFSDKKFRKIAEDVEDQIDCTTCANCCRVATVTLQERDVEKLAKALRIKPSRFIADFTQESEDEGLILRRSEETGCVFLDGNLCSVFEDRPQTCRDFPHLVRGQGSIPSRMWQFIDRASYCPIVYNTLEAFKEEVGFRK